MESVHSISGNSILSLIPNMSKWQNRTIFLVICLAGAAWAANKAWEYFLRQVTSDPDDEPILPMKSYPKTLTEFSTGNVEFNGIQVPNELISHIFSYLELSDAIKFSSTCKSLAFYRTDKQCKVLALFFGFIRLQAEIPCDQTAIYAQFYKKSLWGVYVNSNESTTTISMHECKESSLEKKVAVEVYSSIIRRKKVKPWLHTTNYADGSLFGSVNEEKFLFSIQVRDYYSYRPWCGGITNLGQISPHPPLQGYDSITSICAGPGSICYKGGVDRCTIWEGETYRGDFSVSAPVGWYSPIGLQLLSGGKLLTFSEKGVCQVWDIKNPLNPEVIDIFTTNRDSELKIPWAGVIGSKEQWLVFYHPKKEICEVWDFQRTLKLYSIPLKEHLINCHTVIEDRYLALGLKKGTNSIYIYDLLLGKHVVTYKHDRPILDLRYDEKKLWVACDKKTMIMG